jgi:glycosyltransferase involved in cell wall biosynthesis
MVTLSYCITAWNEAEELKRLLDQLVQHVREEDEIIVQLDTTATLQVKTIAHGYKGVKVITFALNNDFATFKNNVKKEATKDYYFLVDADEYLSDGLMEHLPTILEDNSTVDIWALPRINTVDGLTQAHIDAWRWHVDERGYVNYPDPQTRVCKNVDDIWWVGKVHERLIGPKEAFTAVLPAGFDLIHPKEIKRQEQQNGYYDKI